MGCGKCGLGIGHGVGVFIMTRMDLMVVAGDRSLQLPLDMCMGRERGIMYGPVRGVKREGERVWLSGVRRLLWGMGR